MEKYNIWDSDVLYTYVIEILMYIEMVQIFYISYRLLQNLPPKFSS